MASSEKLTVFVPSGPHTAWWRPTHVGNSVGSTTGGSGRREGSEDTVVAWLALTDPTAGRDLPPEAKTSDNAINRPAAMPPIHSRGETRRPRARAALASIAGTAPGAPVSASGAGGSPPIAASRPQCQQVGAALGTPHRGHLCMLCRFADYVRDL